MILKNNIFGMFEKYEQVFVGNKDMKIKYNNNSYLYATPAKELHWVLQTSVMVMEQTYLMSFFFLYPHITAA